MKEAKDKSVRDPSDLPPGGLARDGYLPREAVEPRENIEASSRLPADREASPRPGLTRRVAAWLRSRRVPIKFKASVLIVLIVLGTVLPTTFLILRKHRQQARDRMMGLGLALAETLAGYSAESVLQADWPALDPFIREAGKMGEVVYAFVTDREGMVRAHTDVAFIDKPFSPPRRFSPVTGDGRLEVIRYRDASGDAILDFALPVSYMGRGVGRVHLGLSEGSMENDARELGYYITLLTMLALGAAVLVSWAAGSLLSRPISTLSQTAREIGAGRLHQRLEPAGNDELGDLFLAFNDMAEGLRRKELLETTFGRYVTPEIADLVLRNPDQIWLKGSLKMATVLFADIRDFTAFAEDREPEEVVGVLNQFFSLATRAVHSEGGIVNKFYGDEVMAVFGAPVYRDDHALKAVRAALKLQASLTEWNQVRAEVGEPPVKAGVGVNTGLVVAGNLGSEQRLEYTVIGDDVNLASRLTEIAGPGDILISEKTSGFIRKRIRLSPLAPIKLKGKKGPVQVFKIEGLPDAAG